MIRECADAGAALLFVSHDRSLKPLFDAGIDFRDLHRGAALMFRHALRSLWNRRFVALLTVLSVAMSVVLILGVERLRGEARDSFTNSASGLDLIVAPRGNPVQILMATVFGVGTTGTGLAWETYERVAALPQVAWSVPSQMSYNHRGFPVIGTTAAYFERFRLSGGRPLAMAAGRFFEDDEPDAVVVGAEVAARFGYVPGSVIVNAHGAGAVSMRIPHSRLPGSSPRRGRPWTGWCS